MSPGHLGYTKPVRTSPKQKQKKKKKSTTPMGRVCPRFQQTKDRLPALRVVTLLGAFWLCAHTFTWPYKSSATPPYSMFKKLNIDSTTDP
jgi:hypothetical protein